MYYTIHKILRYDMIHTIRTLYRTIHEHLRYADTIQSVLHMIRFLSYDTYRVSYDTDNYAWHNNLISGTSLVSSIKSFTYQNY